jgi:hypothetical protein
MMLAVHPFILTGVGCVLAAVVVVIIACRVRSGVATAALAVLALLLLVPPGFVFVALNPGLVDARFRTYQAFYRDIETGMTRAEVLAAMERHYPTNGPRQRPTIMEDNTSRLGFFMNPETSREPNCEGIFLTLQNGRVVSKGYSPD